MITLSCARPNTTSLCIFYEKFLKKSNNFALNDKSSGLDVHDVFLVLTKVLTSPHSYIDLGQSHLSQTMEKEVLRQTENELRCV